MMERFSDAASQAIEVRSRKAQWMIRLMPRGHHPMEAKNHQSRKRDTLRVNITPRS